MRTKAAVAAILAGALIAGGVAPVAQAAGRPDQRRLQTAVDDLHAIASPEVGVDGAGPCRYSTGAARS